MMTKPLFEDFNSVSAKEWKQKIQFDLKGADYNEALIYKSLEGIDIKPFYTAEDLTHHQTVSRDESGSWKNAIKIEVENLENGLSSIEQAIKLGAESLHIIFDSNTISTKKLFTSIDKNLPIHIEDLSLSLTSAEFLNSLANEENREIYLFLDPIGRLSEQGNWFKSKTEDLEKLVQIVRTCTSLKSIFSVDMSLFQNAGATMYQQLAYGLAQANEYLNLCLQNNLELTGEIFFIFKVSLGGNYFFEIAKLRAIRELWKILTNEYGLLKKCYIFAYPSHRNKTILDYNVNMLRTTTECMSAILGGADVVENMRYDDIYHLDNEFGSRIAINQLLILKKESYFDLVNNPTDGAYYIDSLTHQLAEKGLEVFKQIEKAGGYLEQLKAGSIQKKIMESSQKEQALFDKEELILTGTNVYQNKNEIHPELQKKPFVTIKSRKTLLQPIIRKRLAEEIEKKLVN